MCDRFMTMEEIKRVPVDEMVRLMENEEYMTPCEYYIEHDDVPKWLKLYNRLIMFVCYTIGREVLRPIFIFFLGKKAVAAEEYVYKHHKVYARLHFLACFILGVLLTSRAIDGVIQFLRDMLTGGLLQ